jgi:hypothetical protein
MTMPYTYDTESTPLWADSVRGELVTDPVAYAETQPGKLTEADLDRAIAQKRRDTICAASQAPRIPRATRRQVVPHCTGSCNQGRAPCSTPGDCLTSRLSPIDESREYGRLWWGVMTIISVIAVAFALAGCGGGDASADEAAEHDRQTIQPVACAASGCAR